MTKPNPYPVGSEAWHVRNLSNAAWGHVETVTEDDGGLFSTGVIYGPETFIYEPGRAFMDFGSIPDEFYIEDVWIALWRKANVEWVRKTRVRRDTDG